MNPVPKIVRERLQAKPDAVHPDANLLGAFAENSLEQTESAKVLKHLAQCSDCREVVVLAQPEIEATMKVKILPAAPSGFRGLRWAFWAAAVLAVGGMLILNDREKTAPIQIAEVTPAQTIAQATPPAEKAANTPSAAEGKTQLQPRKSVEVSSLDSMEQSAAARAAMKATTQDALAARDAAPHVLAPPSAFSDNMKAEASRMAASAVILSKTTGPRWTLTQDGVLQRSFDSGKTWERVTVASNASFRVVSALGSDIWVGGTAGALYHSSDAGQHWSQVQPAIDGITLTVDITGIEFSDAEHGKVSSLSGIWITSDAGQTWQKQ